VTTSVQAIRPETRPLERELRRTLKGEVLFDTSSRGRYSTDASIYQIQPLGVVVPTSNDDMLLALEVARHHNSPLLARGGGTSQCGQTVGDALVIDYSKHLNKILALDPENQTVRVQPGITLDVLNAALKPHGLFFPIDVSTSSRATIGGMTGNNSCGARSIRYGNMVHNVLGIDAVLADGTRQNFGPVSGDLNELAGTPAYRDMISQLRGIADGAATSMREHWPTLLRRVGGYNIDTLSNTGHNMAHVLVGSEGTLATFEAVDLKLSRIPTHRVLGVCHFPTFYEAMASTQHIVKLDPSAVELVDATMIDLSREIEIFRPTVERFIDGTPAAVLLVEFAGDNQLDAVASLNRLEELMADLGFSGGVVRAQDPTFQSEIWEVRKAGLNIMMSMKGDGKPVSFIEDCAVRLEDLADYTERLTAVFESHGTTGTWYAHASVGCLHVRPILNMKDGTSVQKMRAIAEEAFAMVREYKGSHSGEHGDGLVRSEFHEPMFGREIVGAFEQIKSLFDPTVRMNPGKIVNPPRMDDRSNFRFKPGYSTVPLQTGLDWSEWGGLGGAVEMCNNNGACRKANGGVMCPSYRATRDEQHVTRGRANTLRLALSGQLGSIGLDSDEVADTLSLCVGCKGCRRECPTGVDMSRMKMEVAFQRSKTHGVPLRERLIAHLPHYAPWVSKFHWLANLRDQLPGLAWLSQALTGMSARRSLPRWDAKPYATTQPNEATSDRDVVLFTDTFNRWFESDNARSAERVLRAAGYNVIAASTSDGEDRPLCCGRTYLASGMLDEARAEARRTVKALAPHLARGVPIVGLEPSCLLTMRDEFVALLDDTERHGIEKHAVLFEEFLVNEHVAGRLDLDWQAIPQTEALVHGHCHQKAFGVMGSVTTALNWIPGLQVSTVDSSCCGMAGAFGYQASTYDVSMQMGELDLLPAVRASKPDTLVVADGTSCRHQIEHGAARTALHVAQVLERALPPTTSESTHH
jgi:FAD/FMN-containing dehydrogenase/Fe-S oxidoreductase